MTFKWRKCLLCISWEISSPRKLYNFTMMRADSLEKFWNYSRQLKNWLWNFPVDFRLFSYWIYNWISGSDYPYPKTSEWTHLVHEFRFWVTSDRFLDRGQSVRFWSQIRDIKITENYANETCVMNEYGIAEQRRYCGPCGSVSLTEENDFHRLRKL